MSALKQFDSAAPGKNKYNTMETTSQWQKGQKVYTIDKSGTIPARIIGEIVFVSDEFLYIKWEDCDEDSEYPLDNVNGVWPCRPDFKIEPKHIPGPWIIEKYSDSIWGDVKDTEYHIFEVPTIGPLNNAATAQLISAAPEMINALIGIKKYLTRLLVLQGCNDNEIDYILRDVDAAITKATTI